MKILFFDSIKTGTTIIGLPVINFVGQYVDFDIRTKKFNDLKSVNIWINNNPFLSGMDFNLNNKFSEVFSYIKETDCIVCYDGYGTRDAIQLEIDKLKTNFNIKKVSFIDLKEITDKIPNERGLNIKTLDDLYVTTFGNLGNLNGISNLKKIEEIFIKLYTTTGIFDDKIKRIKDIPQKEVFYNNLNNSIYEPLLEKRGDNPEAVRFLNIVNEGKKSVFLTGKAGSGKSTLIRDIIKQARLSNLNPIVLGSTGIAAVNVGGQTVHSYFGFATEEIHYSELLKYIRKNPQRTRFKLSKKKRKELLDTPFIIIDEVSMLNSNTVDCINALMSEELSQDKGKNYKSFYGKQIIFVGDVFQLPPVVDNSRINKFGNKYRSARFFDSDTFNKSLNDALYKDGNFDYSLIELQKNYRQKDDLVLGNILDHVREGRITRKDMDTLNSCVFSKVDEDSIIIMTTNDDVDEMNNKKLGNLSGKSRFFEAETYGDFPDENKKTKDILELKIGAKIMFLNNDSKGRWINGTMGTIERFNVGIGGIKSLDIRVGNKVYRDIERYTWNNSLFEIKNGVLHEEILGSFTQFPLQLAYAITVHKSQGLTFETCQIDITKIFEGGQAYTAISRVTNLKGIKLLGILKKKYFFFDERIFEFMGIDSKGIDYSDDHGSEDILMKLLDDNAELYEKLPKKLKSLIDNGINTGIITEEDIIHAIEKQDIGILGSRLPDFKKLTSILGIEIDTLYRRIKQNMELLKRRKTLENFSCHLPENNWSYKDSLQVYYRDVMTIPLLTNKEEIELGRKIKAGDKEAKGKLLKSNLWLVIWLAKQYINRAKNLSFMDIIQEGNLGLLRAMERFDPDKGTRFSSYATRWVIQFIIKAIADYDSICRYPVHKYQEIQAYLIDKEYSLDRLGYEPSVEEYSDKKKIPLHKAQIIHNLSLGTVSFEDLLSEDEISEEYSKDRIKFFKGMNELNAIDFVERDKKIKNLYILLDMLLDDREEKILKMYFGLDINYDEPLHDRKERYTLEEIGNEFEISRERVRQILVNSIEKLGSEYVSKVLNEKLKPLSEKDIGEMFKNEINKKEKQEIIDSDESDLNLDDNIAYKENEKLSDIKDDTLNLDDENKFWSDMMKNGVSD